ncbi:LOW QUALITY PROTEIN: hypothetical protein N5P37_007207 [Trichoderma harzianum]|nr:LOW QUALITY PROTEIN: hypothetical protein N5P37_007207 [Trichoderma harzianum]
MYIRGAIPYFATPHCVVEAMGEKHQSKISRFKRLLRRDASPLPPSSGPRVDQEIPDARAAEPETSKKAIIAEEQSLGQGDAHGSKPHMSSTTRAEPTEQQCTSPSKSQDLWNAAYESLAEDKDTVKLVRAYATILATVLKTTLSEDEVLTHLNDRTKRQDFMRKLVEEGQARLSVSTTSNVLNGVGAVAEFIDSVKGLVDAAVGNIPQAALPWAGVCIGLQNGVVVLPDRMLMEKDDVDESGLILSQLEREILSLYKALLQYQMKSICSYYRHQGLQFLRELANLNSWENDYKAIRDAEGVLRHDLDQYIKVQGKTMLEELLGRAKGMVELLGDLRQTLQDIVIYQKSNLDERNKQCLRDLFVVDPQDDMKKIEKNKDTVPETEGSLVELDSQKLQKPVNAFIDHKISLLKGRPGYTDEILEQARNEVSQRGENTFLWVALAFKELDKEDGNHIVVDGMYALDIIKEIPSGLSKLYDYMMGKIEKVLRQDREYRRNVLVAALLAFPMSSGLRQNMYNLDYGFKPDDMRPPQPDSLAPLQYSCVFWADHLTAAIGENFDHEGVLADDGEVLKFLREKFLHWLEGLSLVGNLLGGVDAIRKLLSIAQVQNYNVLSLCAATDHFQKSNLNSQLTRFLEDAERFIQSHGSIIERAPLQAYGSALVFSPTTSEVKAAQWKHSHKRTLVGHYGNVESIALSPDDTILASSSLDSTVRLWDIALGSCRQTIEERDAGIGDKSVAFSPDGRILASVSRNGIIRLWDVALGKYQQKVDELNSVHRVIFSPDGNTLAVLGVDHSIQLWDTSSWRKLKTLDINDRQSSSLAFSPNGKMLAFMGPQNSILLWDMDTDSIWDTLVGHHGTITSLAFSPDGMTLASASWDRTIKLWDTSLGKRHGTVEEHNMWHSGASICTTFSPDGEIIVSASRSGFQVWDTARGGSAVAFSPDSKTLATASRDEVISCWLWDVTTGSTLWTLDRDWGTNIKIRSVAFSPDGKTLASALDDCIDLWDAATGIHQQGLSLEGQIPDFELLDFSLLAFSPDGKTLASASSGSRYGDIWLWHDGAGRWSNPKKLINDHAFCLSFSPDGAHLLVNHRPVRLLSTSASLEERFDEDPAESLLYFEQEWIMLNGKEILWLPADYRPYPRYSVIVHGNKMAWINQAGSQMFFQVTFAEGMPQQTE